MELYVLDQSQYHNDLKHCVLLSKDQSFGERTFLTRMRHNSNKKTWTGLKKVYFSKKMKVKTISKQ